MTTIQHYPVSTGSEDVCQRVTFYYDTNPFSGSYSHYALGRQTAVKYQGAGCADITPSTFTAVNPNTLVLTEDLEATYAYNNEGKMTGMTDQTTVQTAVSRVTYGPAGEMLTVHYGGINESRTYNSLTQLTALSAFNVGLGQTVFGRQYSYSGTANNGKIQSETNTLSGEVVSYQYDSLNRLMQAGSSSWGQSFGYDGFGNLMDKNVTLGSAPTYHTTFNAATNRDNSMPYDANGNQTAIPGIPLGYDVENRITMATPTGTADVYSYGRGNRRVYAANWQWNGTKYDLMTEKVSFYSVTGQKLGTYQLYLNTAPPGPPTETET